MNDNNIETVETKVFHGLNKLRRLHLNNNKIVHLHYQTFLRVKSLRFLFLENNRIEYIDVRLFKYVKKLKALDVSRNRLKELEPNTFQQNRLLSWVNFRHNHYIENIAWKTIFKYSLNFSDIQFCEVKNDFNNIYIKRSKSDRNFEQNSGLNSRLSIGDDKFEKGDKLILKYSFIKSQNLSFEEFDALIRTIGYDEYSTVITRHNDHITFLTDYPIFCYCESCCVWFWCHELKEKCSNDTSILIAFTFSKCTSEVADKLRLPVSVLPNSTSSSEDSDSEVNEGQSHSDKTDSNSKERIVIYASIAVGITLVMIITAGILLYKQRSNTQHGTEDTNRVIELGDLNNASANNNVQSSLLTEP